MNKILTPDEIVINLIEEYPSLYLTENYNISKMDVFDHIFNTIGNGIRDDEELIENLTGEPKTLSEKAFKESFWYGYLEDSDTYSFELIAECYESDKVNYPQVNRWIEVQQYRFTPYPNFQKQYSTVYECPIFFTLGKEWIDAALWFYVQCKEWFKENSQYYYYSFPHIDEINIDTTEYQINDMKRWLEKYSTNEEITEAYGVEYTGDVHLFLTKQWEKELNRINVFIDETIELLKSKI